MKNPPQAFPFITYFRSLSLSNWLVLGRRDSPTFTLMVRGADELFPVVSGPEKK